MVIFFEQNVVVLSNAVIDFALLTKDNKVVTSL